MPANEQMIERAKAYHRHKAANKASFLSDSIGPDDLAAFAQSECDRSPWVAVDDRLPEVSGDKLQAFLFQQIGDDDMFDVLYLDVPILTNRAQYFKSRYVAWQKIPPYPSDAAADCEHNWQSFTGEHIEGVAVVCVVCGKLDEHVAGGG